MHVPLSGLSASRSLAAGLLAGTLLALSAPAAQAISLTSFKDQGMDPFFGSYAPRSDCSKEPRVTIDDTGMTFRARGRTVKPDRVEYALTFWGQRYDGIVAVFYPFPVSTQNLGPVLMFVNDNEKRGVIRFESELLRGQRADPFHAAFTGGGLFTLCQGSAPANTPEPAPSGPGTPVQGLPVEWHTLASLVDKYPGSYSEDNIDLFDQGAVAAALRTLLGDKLTVLKTNLSVVSPLQRFGNLYYLSGNAPHQGGVDQAYVILDPTRRAVQVGLWERGKLTVYPPARGARLPAPPDIRAMLDNSPGETAVPLPGTPWEVVPVQGRAPLAYVSAAASPRIEALGLYCEGSKPYMTMLLTQPSGGNTLTVTWNFAGGQVNIPVRRANANGTQWSGGVSGTPLLPLLMRQTGTVMLRINGRGEGEASLAQAPAVLRSTLKACARL